MRRSRASIIPSCPDILTLGEPEMKCFILLEMPSLLLLPFYPFVDLHCELVRVDEILQSSINLRRLGHRISWIAVTVNPSYFCDESSLVCLAKAHDIDHQSLFLGGTESDEALV